MCLTWTNIRVQTRDNLRSWIGFRLIHVSVGLEQMMLCLDVGWMNSCRSAIMCIIEVVVIEQRLFKQITTNTNLH